MPKNYKLSPAAQRDFRDILRYIASNNMAAAETMKELFLRVFLTIGQHPYIGSQREDLTCKPVRFFAAHRNYMIIYDANVSPVKILRIYNAAKSVATIIH